MTEIISILNSNIVLSGIIIATLAFATKVWQGVIAAVLIILGIVLVLRP